MKNRKSPQVISLGCRLNIFEAELIKDQAILAKMDNTIIVNTCTVTQEAHRQSKQQVRKLKRDNPTAQIIVTGCGAQIDPQGFAKMPEVNKIIGNEDKFSSTALTSLDKIIVSSSPQAKNYNIPLIKGFAHKTKAFIQIQQGCDHRCTFCIINQARGKSRSILESDIITQIKQVVNFGHQEVVLTGVDISSWNRDALTKAPSKLGELCMNILKAVPQLTRLRLSSLDPAVFDANIITLLQTEERFMPHIHLSLQSMNNTVLTSMGRRHRLESATDFILKLLEANPNIAIGADMICGFPAESELQHLATLKAIQQLKIPFLHIFPYSERAGTIATKIKPIIPMAIRKERVSQLRKIGNHNKAVFFAQQVNKTMTMMVESNNLGYSNNYCPILLESEESFSKKIIKVKIISYNHNHLIAQPITY